MMMMINMMMMMRMMMNFSKSRMTFGKLPDLKLKEREREVEPV